MEKTISSVEGRHDYSAPTIKEIIIRPAQRILDNSFESESSPEEQFGGS